MKKILLSIFLILCFSLTGCDSQVENIPDSSEKPVIETSETSTSETLGDYTVENKILEFVTSFNESSKVSLVYEEDFTPSDQSSPHYRTEFRLGAYSDALGKSYVYDNAVVDLVGRQDLFGDIIVRIYMKGTSLDQCVEMLKYASPIMDPDIDASELQETIDYVAKNKEANGYYYANLGLALSGNDSKGYNFMLKMGND